MENNRKIGSDKELIAAEYLRRNNIEVICMNFRTKYGEIDIIGKDGEYYVFVEVKYRKNTNFGFPEEAVNTKKQQTIRKVAQFFMIKHKIPMESPVRFDVISILGKEITHIRNAF